MDVIVDNMEILKKDTFRKNGASKYDIKMIAELNAQGRSVEQISVILNVKEAVVRAFVPAMDETPTEMEIATPPPPAEAEKQPSGFFKTKKKKR